jgi:hypothetical protein
LQQLQSAVYILTAVRVAYRRRTAVTRRVQIFFEFVVCFCLRAPIKNSFWAFLSVTKEEEETKKLTRLVRPVSRKKEK